MHIRSLLAGGAVVVAVVAVPVTVLSVAHASPGTSAAATAPSDGHCPRADLRQDVADYLAAHPDVAAEVAALRALPAGDRPAARAAYLADNPDVAQAVQQLHQQRRDLWWELAGDASAALAAHPAVADMVHALADVPVGERAEAGRQYLADHPDVRAELADLRHDTREARQDCRNGG